MLLSVAVLPYAPVCLALVSYIAMMHGTRLSEPGVGETAYSPRLRLWAVQTVPLSAMYGNQSVGLV